MFGLGDASWMVVVVDGGVVDFLWRRAIEWSRGRRRNYRIAIIRTSFNNGPRRG